ncbi:MAG TPA: tetratricopeptide repeat protein [Desulfomonilaceae bacterium]|nr:tetratricopeptide repeat protein [Desulfomonilaceae bacterium]
MITALAAILLVVSQFHPETASAEQRSSAVLSDTRTDVLKSGVKKSVRGPRVRKANTGWFQPAKSSTSSETQVATPPQESEPVNQPPEQADTPAPEVGNEAGGQAKPDQMPDSSGASVADRTAGATAGGLLNQATEQAKNGQYAEALEAYQAAIKKGVSSRDQKLTAAALSGAARMLHALGRSQEALEHVNRAIAINLAVRNAKARSLDYLLAGQILMAQGDYGEALKSFEESQKILPSSEASEIPKLLENSATCQLRLNRALDAASTLNRLLSILTRDRNDLESARINLQMGEIQVARSDYQAARISFAKAEKLYRDLKRDKDAGETLLRTAYLDLMQGDLKAAQKAIEEGQTALGAEAEPANLALPLMVRGLIDHQEGKTIQASNNLAAALNAYEKAGDQLMAARTRLALANVELDRARLQSALELAGQALEQFRSLSSIGGESAALLLIGEVYFRQGFVQKALAYAQDSLAASKKVNDRSQLCMSRVLIAEIYMGMGNMESASKSLKEAVEDVKGGGVNRQSMAQVRLTLARYRLAKDASDKALQDATDAHKEFLEIDDRRGVADSDHLIGLIHEMRGEREQAESKLQMALSEHRATFDRFGEGRDLTALGVHYKNVGDYEKAQDYFTQAMDLRNGIGDRRGFAANLANLGNLLRHRNRIPEAVQNLEQALAVYRELSDKKGEADILTNLGNVEAARGSLATALERFTSAVKLHREIQDIKGISIGLTSMGRLYLAKGDLENASTFLDEAEKLNKRIHNPRGDVAILTELAMLQRAKRHPRDALSSLNKALNQAVSLNDTRAISAINLKMASVLEDTGDYTKALSLLSETLEALRRQGDREGELWALSGIAVMQAKTEDYENAIVNLQQALKLRSELGLPPSRSRDLDFYLGEIYEGFRDLEPALDHYHKALASSQTDGNHAGLARIHDRIGSIYYLMEDYAKAREFLEEALRLNSEAGDTSVQKNEMVRLGDILSKLGDTEGALKYQQKALVLARETGDQRTEARTLTRIGTLHQVLGRPRVALDEYNEAKEIRTKLGDRRGITENLLQIALVTSILGDFDSATSDLKDVFEIVQRSEDRSALWKAYFIMGRTLEGKKSLGEALESYRKALAILEAMEADIIEESDEDNFIFGGKTALFETTLRVLMTLAKKDPGGAYDDQALRIAERLKAAAFENSLERINIEKFSDVPQELLIREKSLRLSLRKLNSRLAEEISKANSDQAQIQKILEERRAKGEAFIKLKERLVKEYPAYADLRYPKPINLHQLQREIIHPDEAVLAYMVTRSRTYLFAIDKQRFHSFSISYAGAEMQRDVETLTRPLLRADTQAHWDPSVAYRLYSQIIKPIEYFLVGKKTVVVLPHGPLTSLPFEMLVSSEAHAGKRFWSATNRPTYLLENYTFCYAPSASVLSHIRMRKRDKQPGWSLVAFGDAVYSNPDKTAELNPGADKVLTALNSPSANSRGTELRPLPGARKEIAEIVRLMEGPSQVYVGAEATETLFKKADLSRYRYVHLATHGLLVSGSGKRQQPSIIFSLYGDQENDGFLQLGEVFGLKLNADLVVLSSCLSAGKTDSEDADGLMALARAFLFAGSESVILGLWQVNDESTAKLFIDMYRALRENSKAEALRQAKLSLLQDPATSHPYFWAPFILVGNWNVAFKPRPQSVDSDIMRFKGLSSWKKLFKM